MTELQQYLAEEVAEDHVDGIITRREAMRRLGLLGVGATAASAMLAAEAAREGRRRTRRRSRRWPRPRSRPDGSDLHVGAGRRASRSRSPGPRGAAAGGVGAGRRQAARRRARDPREPRADRAHPQRRGALRRQRLLARSRSTCSPRRAARARSRARREVAAKLSEISGANPARFDDDMKAALTELAKRACRARPTLGAIGFCFGGGMIWRLLATREPRLAAAAPFYGPFPTGASLQGQQGRRARRLRRARRARERARCRRPRRRSTPPGSTTSS